MTDSYEISSLPNSLKKKYSVMLWGCHFLADFRSSLSFSFSTPKSLSRSTYFLSTRIPFSMKVYTSSSPSEFASYSFFLFVTLLFVYGAKNLKSMTDECSVNRHMLVYSRSKAIGTKVERPVSDLLI